MTTREPSWSRIFSKSNSLLVVSFTTIALFACATFFGNLRFGEKVLGVGFADDFFYYAQVARNLAMRGSSTFDGIHLTNGYHPLWLLLLAGLTKVFGIGGLLHSNSVTTLALALETLQLSLTIATLYFSFRICRLFCSVAASCTIQLLLAGFILILARSGMEVALTLAFAFGLLWLRLRPAFNWSPAHCFGYGTVASLVVLSRLDSVILIALLVVFDLLLHNTSTRARVIQVASFLAGMWLVPAYAMTNRLIFHTYTPVSGMAKQLRFHHTPSGFALYSFLRYLPARSTLFLGPCVLLTVAALVTLATRKDQLPSRFRGVFWASLLFPFVYLFATVTLSDWQLWQWYLYGWLFSGVVAAIVIFSRLSSPIESTALRKPGSPSRSALVYLALAFAFFVTYTGAVIVNSTPRDNPIYTGGVEISDFIDAHPGLYAMGDRAGIVGYLARSPVIQLEGLMMDKDYLANIKQQRNAIAVMRQYGVRYYVSTWDKRDSDGCYLLREPSKAGADSPVMRARLCQEPVAVIADKPFVSRIFDLDREMASSR